MPRTVPVLLQAVLNGSDIHLLLDALPDSPVGKRAAWVLQQLRAVASGGSLPGTEELEGQYTEMWRSEVPVAAILSEVAPLAAAVTHFRSEPAPPNEARAVLDLSDGRMVRFGVRYKRAHLTGSTSGSSAQRWRRRDTSTGSSDAPDDPSTFGTSVATARSCFSGTAEADLISQFMLDGDVEIEA